VNRAYRFDGTPCQRRWDPLFHLWGVGTSGTIDPRRPIRFAGQVRRYARCRECGSLSLYPMPSDTELAPLHGLDYNSQDNDGLRLESDPRAVGWIIGIVQSLDPDRFVDYGCGSGELLRRVATTGVEAVGFDLDASGVEGVEEASLPAGCTAYTYADLGDHLSTADVLHIGDVLEHVPNPMSVLDKACSLLHTTCTSSLLEVSRGFSKKSDRSARSSRPTIRPGRLRSDGT